MDQPQLLLSGLLTLILYGIGIFAVYRIVQIGNEVSEVKNMLRDLKRSIEDVPAVAPVIAPPPQTAEDLVRSVHESYKSSFDD